MPLPSQLPTGIAVDPVQDTVPQLVPAGIGRHAPLPSQVPLNPQGGLAAHPPCGSIAPAGTGRQVPALPATLHDVQVPQLAVEQLPTLTMPVTRNESAASPLDLSVKRRTEELERALIKEALERTRGNRTRAAKLLDLSHRALLYKIRDYGLGD